MGATAKRLMIYGSVLLIGCATLAFALVSTPTQAWADPTLTITSSITTEDGRSLGNTDPTTPADPSRLARADAGAGWNDARTDGDPAASATSGFLQRTNNKMTEYVGSVAVRHVGWLKSVKVTDKAGNTTVLGTWGPDDGNKWMSDLIGGDSKTPLSGGLVYSGGRAGSDLDYSLGFTITVPEDASFEGVTFTFEQVVENPVEIEFNDGSTTVATYERWDSALTSDTCREAPQAPGHEGKRFVGWVKSDDTRVTWPGASAYYYENRYGTSYVAKYVDEYTVSFDTQGGSSVASQSVISGEAATKPVDPTYEGHVFKGWFVEGSDEPYDFSAPVTANLELVAQWEAVPVTSTPEPDNEGDKTTPPANNKNEPEKNADPSKTAAQATPKTFDQSGVLVVVAGCVAVASLATIAFVYRRARRMH